MPLTMETQPKLDAAKKVEFGRILVLTDFSEASAPALDYGLALARRYDGRIYLAHVVPPYPYAYAEPATAQQTYEQIKQNAEQEMADILVSGRLRGVPHEVLVEEGPIAPAALDLIRKYEIDLVVLGTHGRGNVKKFFVGSVAEEIFRQSDRPVLTVGPRVKGELGKAVEVRSVLFATDFGPAAEKAAAYALSLAQEHQARLTFLHVVEEAAGFTEESIQRQRDLYVDRMKRMMPPGAENWCKPQFRVTFGTVAEEIVMEVREHNAGLLVMGVKATGLLAGHTPLTIAYNVVAKAPCPVLTVRA
jgi:nucleotide-binding universal stress UspA family protein